MRMICGTMSTLFQACKKKMIQQLLVIGEKTNVFEISAKLPRERLRFTEGQHLVTKLEKRRPCIAHRKRRKDTTYACDTCHVPLSIECFKRYHNDDDYSLTDDDDDN